MKAPRSRIAQAIADKTLKSGSSKHFSSEIAAYLLAERRVSELDSLMRDTQGLWAEAGYVEVIASSAFPLSDTVVADIRQQVAGLYPAAKQIVVTHVVAPEVIGGVRLSLADLQLDLSVQAKLNKFKQLTEIGKE